MTRSMFLATVSSALLLEAQGTATLARWPYLQNIGENHASILWTTVGSAGSGLVRIGGREFRSRVLTIPPEESELPFTMFQHQVDVSGLAPDSPYSYEVMLDGVTRMRGSLRTSGAPRYQFLALGDSGDGGQPQRQLALRMAAESPAFILHTGDIAYYDGRFEQYDELYFPIYRELMARVPFFPAMGNHDCLFRDGLAYRTVHAWPGWPTLYYSFDWGDVHFVSLDTNQSLDLAIDHHGEMLRWLERDLLETRKLFRVVILHHLPFPTANYRGDARSMRVAEHVVPILERAGVHLVLTGHEHLYQRTKPRNGIIYVTTGGGGSTVYPPVETSFLEFGAGVSHYVRVSVRADELTGEAVNMEGEVIDSFRVQAEPRMAALANAAGPVEAAPGGLASLYGTNLLDAKIRFDSQAATVLYTSWRQVNLLVPASVTAGEQAITIETRGGVRRQIVRLVERAPYIFRVGEGAAAITHADHRLVNGANAACLGEVVAVYLTGLGPLPAPVSIEVGGIAAQVLYAGEAPGLPGVNQVNFRLPPGAPGGEANLTLRTTGATASAVIPIRPSNSTTCGLDLPTG